MPTVMKNVNRTVAPERFEKCVCVVGGGHQRLGVRSNGYMVAEKVRV